MGRFLSEETRQKITEKLKQRGRGNFITPKNAPIGFFNWRISAYAIEQEMKKKEEFKYETNL